ncbi:Armadillo-type fold protein [Cordyceps fumosorosea ARSEF 2679]|uniref:Protein SERAC1 n=1 Tax=Cordyceps fumosorosea (strain ARSEF 2679) TaxID=1081104 RepID=A0A167MPQ0_CORFA|nr:Armadillo-type fold protein [Cordyceps fumosorosea ARSEF 2679]OAA54617.1 Armadillo-type fold protein [Cordyceps fumosorosea ARSEF 2679]
MAMEWRWMTSWWACLVIVTLLLARSIHRVISKICRPRDELRSGILQNLTPTLEDAKFEIIAVPGLGAHPYHTWEARKTPGPSAAEYQTSQSAKVHLLKDLLARDFPKARIWNFAHDSNWLIDAPVKTTAEIGKCLITEIKDKRSSPHLPIIFISHSLGGIIIKQALCSNDSQEIVDDTSGILFLGTPHQGSSVSVAGALLAWITGFLGSDTTLLLSLKSNDQQLSTLAANFKQCIASSNKRRQENIRISSFYETKKTYLFGLSLGVMVSQNSAVVHDDAGESHSIETDHSGLNKCGEPNDALYTKLTAAVRHLKAPSLLEQADTWIRDKHYTADRLKIERLSGELLPMEQCYINLAIVEQSGQDAGHSRKEGDTAPSPFSILARQKVQTPDKTMQVELVALFNERNGRDDRPMHPRRILIRGRAGVGKTTLCKKIVHEFSKGALGKWNELFERVLWVPLRNLKLPERCGMPKYTFEDLFSHEYLLPTNGQNLARALFHALNTENSKTLFLLDGLDEISQDLTGDGGMPRFLDELLSQPNVVVTSRPSATSPSNLHLELDTIGFGPDQVNEYIQKSFTNRETAEMDQIKVNRVQSFLQERWLIQGLVRIPIQLDALCYTWDDLKPDIILNTMTGLYREIELKLWKKDILRLEKRHEDKVLTKENLAAAGRRKIERFVEDELAFIESLAFTGLYNDVAARLDDKDAGVRAAVIKALGSQAALANEVLIAMAGRLDDEDLNVRLAAVKALGGQVALPNEILMAMAARLDDRDWSVQNAAIGALARQAALPDEVRMAVATRLPDEGPWVPVPAYDALAVLAAQLDEGPTTVAARLDDEDWVIRITAVGENCFTRAATIDALAERAILPGRVFMAVAERLDDEDSYVRRAAVEALGGQAALLDEVLLAVAERLDDEDSYVRRAAVEALGGQAALPNEVVMAMAALLDDEDSRVRSVVIEALGGRIALSDEVLMAVAAQLDGRDSNVRSAATDVLAGRAVLPDEVITAVAARLGDKNPGVRSAAVDILMRKREHGE